MLVKRRFIIIFLVLGLFVFQAHAWPWDPPEQKARALVKKLEEFASELDGVDVAWNPTYAGLAREITGSGPVIVPILIEEVLDTTNAWNFRYLCEDRLIFVKEIDRENANQIIDTYIKILRDKDEVTALRNNAADALDDIGRQTEEIDGVRLPTAHWVSLLTPDKREEIVVNLIAVARDESEGATPNSVRWHSIGALVLYRDYAEMIVDSLLLNLNEPYSHIRAITVNTLGGIGMSVEQERIGEILVNELRKGERGLASSQVLFWIKRLKIRESIPLLLESLETEKYCLKADAAELLGKWKVKEAEPALLHLLKTGKRSERYKAIEALGNIKSKEAVEPLIEIIKRHGSLTEKAAEALGKIGDPRAIEPIMEVFKEAEKYHVSASEEIPRALMALGAREAIPLIEERYHELQRKYPNSRIWSGVYQQLQHFKEK